MYPSDGEISSDETAFTVANGNGDEESHDAFYIQTRPALLVSSTSWTGWFNSNIAFLRHAHKNKVLIKILSYVLTSLPFLLVVILVILYYSCSNQH